MTDAAGIASGAPSSTDRRESLPYAVELIGSWDDALRRAHGELAHANMTPFQHEHWLGAWYGVQSADPDTVPMIAIVRDRRLHIVLAILPLVVRSWRGLRIAEFAGDADYNAPILSAAAEEHLIEAQTFWSAIRSALASAPEGCDLVRFRKMPMIIAHLPNPLAALPTTEPCALTGHHLEPGEDYEAFRHARERTFRKELERCWRVFTKHEGACFERITDPARALQVFATLEAQQSARMRGLGHEYKLDDEASAAFHRDLIRRGTGSGYVVMTALTCGETIVATLLGIRVGTRYLMVRISNIGDEWSNCSPGRLIIERTVADLHGDGVRAFDFSVGTYDYKRRFGVVDLPLRDLVAAISLRGHAMIAAQRTIKATRAVMAALRRG